MSQSEGPAPQPAIRERVEKRAYAIWESEGKPHGRDVIHWCQAEQELLSSGECGPASGPVEQPASPATPEKAASAARQAA